MKSNIVFDHLAIPILCDSHMDYIEQLLHRMILLAIFLSFRGKQQTSRISKERTLSYI